MNRRTFLKRTALSIAVAQIPVSLRLLASEPDKKKAKIIAMTPPRVQVQRKPELGCNLVTADILYGTGDGSPIGIDQHWYSAEYCNDIEGAKARCIEKLQNHLLGKYSAYTPIKLEWKKLGSTIHIEGLFSE